MASQSFEYFLHSSRQNVHILYNGPPLSPSKLPMQMGRSGPASNTCFPGPTQLSVPNGILIVSAIFVQFMAESAYTLQWAAPFPFKTAHSHGGSGPYAIHGSLGSPESTTQTVSPLVQQFLHNSRSQQTHHAIVCNNRPIVEYCDAA